MGHIDLLSFNLDKKTQQAINTTDSTTNISSSNNNTSKLFPLKDKTTSESSLDREQINRSLNLVIVGLDKKVQENTLKMLKTKFQLIFKINTNDILEAERIGKNLEKNEEINLENYF